jgi:hypothetical protein
VSPRSWTSGFRPRPSEMKLRIVSVVSIAETQRCPPSRSRTVQNGSAEHHFRGLPARPNDGYRVPGRSADVGQPGVPLREPDSERRESSNLNPRVHPVRPARRRFPNRDGMRDIRARFGRGSSADPSAPEWSAISPSRCVPDRRLWAASQHLHSGGTASSRIDR